jgi:sodium-dependent phosphate transporter
LVGQPQHPSCTQHKPTTNHTNTTHTTVIAAIHARAEKFDPRTERIFGYLQVFSAIAVIFAHGAGEVGFMAGPLSAIYDIYQTGVLNKSVQAQIWCVVISAASLVVGLATYGYNVTRAMGVALSKLTPSRGFACELATALVILVASQLGLPTSSSMCITGAIVGVGLLEGWRAGVNWGQFGKQVLCFVCLSLRVAFALCLRCLSVFLSNKIPQR